jgi:hypothetical protein
MRRHGRYRCAYQTLTTTGVPSAAGSDHQVAEQFWKVLNLVELTGRPLRSSVTVRVGIANLPPFGRKLPNAR